MRALTVPTLNYLHLYINILPFLLLYSMLYTSQTSSSSSVVMSISSFQLKDSFEVSFFVPLDFLTTGPSPSSYMHALKNQTTQKQTKKQLTPAMSYFCVHLFRKMFGKHFLYFLSPFHNILYSLEPIPISLNSYYSIKTSPDKVIHELRDAKSNGNFSLLIFVSGTTTANTTCSYGCFKAYRLLGIKGTSSGDLTYSIMKWFSSKEPACQEMWVQPLGQEDLLEKQMATHCSIIAWKIPQTEKPDGLQSMWSQRVRYN